MKDLPDELKVLKNSIRQEKPWLILLDITLNNDAEDVLYLVRNTEDIVFNGNTYTAFNFNLEMNKLTNAGEIPSLKASISNADRTLQGYLEDLDGMVGSTCKITVVNSSNLSADHTELEQIWDIVETTVSDTLVSFRLSLPNLLRVRYPLTRFLANHCSFTYRFSECGYIGELPTCKRTLDACKAHSNTARYGGYVGLSSDSVRVV